jgi:hypothetical protein
LAPARAPAPPIAVNLRGMKGTQVTHRDVTA